MNSVNYATNDLPEDWPVQVLRAYTKLGTRVELPISSELSTNTPAGTVVAGGFGWLTKQMRSELGKLFAPKRRRTREGRFAEEGPLGATDKGRAIRAKLEQNSSMLPAPWGRRRGKRNRSTIGPYQVLTDNITINGNMTEEMLKHVDDLTHVPEDLQKALINAGVKIFITNGPVTDFSPESKGNVPRGWEGSGKTSDDVAGGYFVGKQTAVMGVVNRGRRAHGSLSLALHEYGHAVDENFHPNGVLSFRPAFYNLSRKVNWRSSYFSQPGRAGPSEAFAEIFAAIKLTNEERSDYFRAITKDQKSAEHVEEMFQWIMETLKNESNADTAKEKISQKTSEEINPAPYYDDDYLENDPDSPFYNPYSGWDEGEKATPESNEDERKKTERIETAKKPATTRRTEQETTALTSFDPQKRLRAINDITNQEVLREVAQKDRNESVALQATLKITDPETLKDLALNSQFDNVRIYAFHRLGDKAFASEYLKKEKIEMNIDSVLNQVEDPKILKSIVDENENDSVKAKAASRITDQNILKNIMENQPSTQVRISAAENITDQNLISELLQNETNEFVRERMLKNIATINALNDVEAEKVAATTKNKDILMEAVRHPSLEVRMAAVRNREIPAEAIADLTDDPETKVRVSAALLSKATPETLETFAKDSERDVRAAVALNWKTSPETRETLTNDPDEVVRIIAKAKEQPKSLKSQFSMTKQQLTDAVQSLSATDQSAPRSPSITDDPSVVMTGLMTFFEPEVTGITSEEIEQLKSFQKANENIDQLVDKMMKGLVAERITDKMKDVPLEQILDFVTDVWKAIGVEGIEISSYSGTGRNREIEDIISGIGSSQVSDVLQKSDGKPKRYNTSEIMELLRTNDGRTMLVLDRVPSGKSISEHLKIVRLPEGEVPNPGAGFASSALLGTPEAETIIRDHLSAHMVLWWAQNVNDAHPGSLAVQERAAQLFDPEGKVIHSDWKMQQGLADNVASITSKHGELIDKFLQAQYEQTQDVFSALGIKEVTLYRGIVEVLDDDGKSLTILDGPPGQSASGEPVELMELASLLPRPLSSWSHSEDIAEMFASSTLLWDVRAGERAPEHDYRYTAVARIPVEKILSTPISGNGSMPDKEYVTIGANNEAFIINESTLGDSQGVPRNMVGDQMTDIQSEPPKTVSVDNNDTNADWAKTVLRKQGIKNSVQKEVNKLEAAETGGKMTKTSQNILNVFEGELNAGRSTVVQMFMALPPELRKEFYQAMSKKRGQSSPKIVAAQLKAILRTATPQQREQYAKQREVLARRSV